MSKNVNFKNLQNQKFGYLTALYIDEKSSPKVTYWVCRCDCGKTRSLQTYQLTSGKVTSCGCHNKRKANPLIQQNKRMYSLYRSMLARCYYPNSINYKYYGKKGITVCDEWKNSFENFLCWALSSGYNDNLSIDRIDNNKGYEPNNCRWVILKEQFENKTTSVKYTHNGETHNLKDWCTLLNFSYSLAKSRRKEAKKKGIEPSFDYVFSEPKFTRS